MDSRCVQVTVWWSFAEKLTNPLHAGVNCTNLAASFNTAIGSLSLPILQGTRRVVRTLYVFFLPWSMSYTLKIWCRVWISSATVHIQCGLLKHFTSKTNVFAPILLILSLNVNWTEWRGLAAGFYGFNPPIYPRFSGLVGPNADLKPNRTINLQLWAIVNDRAARNGIECLAISSQSTGTNKTTRLKMVGCA